jgi:glycosyltransferase involved in cell wall biosynthesis
VSTFARREPASISIQLHQQPRQYPAGQEPTILLVSNSAWNIYNFRLSLVRRLRDEGYRVVAVAPPDAYAERLSAEKGVAFEPLHFLQRKSLSIWGNIRLMFELYGLYRRLKPQLIIHYTIKPNIFGSLAAWLTRVHSASSLEGQGYIGNNGQMLRSIVVMLYKLAFRAADNVIFLNENDRQEFITQGLVKPPKAVLIHGPGVNTQYFSAAPKPKGAVMKFLYLGRVLGEKGVYEFVEAARICRQRQLPVLFQVLGNPDPDNPTTVVQAEIDGWVAEGVIEYLGYLDDVRPALDQADVVVLPSMYREGVPRSLLEAMAMSKIVITSDRPGCRDTVEVNKNGFTVPVPDAVALANMCEHCANLPAEVLYEMGRYGREMVKREFDDPIVIQKYFKLIDSILATQHAAKQQ